MNLKELTVIGCLGNDAEVKQSKDGNSYISFSVAVNSGYKDKNGNWINSTTWANVTYFKESKVVEYLKKGKLVYVKGKVKWEINFSNGNEYLNTYLTANEIILLNDANANYMKLEITGNLGGDAVINETNGKKVIRFSVAVNDKITDESGQLVEGTQWVTVFCRRELNLEHYKKGQGIYVRGAVKASMFRTKGGEAIVNVILTMDESCIMYARKKDDDSPEASNSTGFEDANVVEDDLPF